ncbi:hypothetical protein ABMY26_18460 [Azospirillum sp. HJ39]|uniref:hypothetical protein n=1 Tax=Azospirillum sp. HJ39 TaxID=3159496 RepID=UPI00355708DB
MTIEPAEESEEESRRSLRDDIATGLADADAGRKTEGEPLFERLITKYARTGQAGQE